MGNTMNKPLKLRKQQGMSFLEVIIALVILVTGILGAVAMQATAKQGSFDAMQRSLASSLAQDIIARMRANAPLANPDLTLNGYARDDYGSVLDGAGDRCDVAPGCNSIDMIANDMYEWELALMGGDVTLDGKNAGGLIGAAACISQSLVDSNEYTIIVSWQARTGTTDSANNTCGASGKKRRQVVVQAFIYNI
jgi:type IV pilus assembly protein PilV